MWRDIHDFDTVYIPGSEFMSPDSGEILDAHHKFQSVEGKDFGFKKVN